MSAPETPLNKIEVALINTILQLASELNAALQRAEKAEAERADAILELVMAADEYLAAQRSYAKATLSAEVAADNYSDSDAELGQLAEAISRVSVAEKRLQAALAKLNGNAQQNETAPII